METHTDMKKLGRFVLFALAGTALLTSCTENSLVPEDQRNRDNRNVQAWVQSYWGPDIFSYDSVYAVTGGEIEIESVLMVISDYNFSLSTADTVDIDTTYSVMDMTKQKHKIGFLPSGTYTGEHQIKVGYEEEVFYFLPHSQAPSVLLQEGIQRNIVGYNHLVVKGKYRLDNDTINLKPILPFEYRLGGPEFNIQFEKSMSFSVTANNPINIFLNLDVSKLFAGLSPVDIQQINSDPNNNDDYLAAQVLYLNLDQALSIQ